MPTSLPDYAPRNPIAGTTRRAVIDVGTNSVKLLVGDVAGSLVEPVLETSDQTRLGAGFYHDRRLREDAIARTARAARRLAAESSAAGATRLRVIATSAARDAVNGADLAAALEAVAGCHLEILSGEQEAEWLYLGVTTDRSLADRPLLIIDAGGGSTEFVGGVGGHVAFRGSYQLGTVRWLEHHPIQDPPAVADWERCRASLDQLFTTTVRPSVRSNLDQLPPQEWIGVGASGTATILARLERGVDTYDRGRLEGVTLSRERLSLLRAHLWSLPLAERRRFPGLPPERADVILPGLAIYEAALRHLELPVLRVTLRGLRFAALLDAV